MMLWTQTMSEMIKQADLAGLRILRYPDPRLTVVCAPVEAVDDSARALIDRMFELMFEARGVGLAASQVGLPVRLFIASATFDPADRGVYVNPTIIAAEGTQDGDEGCLSFPGISCRVKRKKIATIRALGRDGNPFEQTGEDLLARIFQHESDHLEGKLLVDRMGSVSKLANRRLLREMEDNYASSSASAAAAATR
jgi:peptide deformylase